MTGDILAECGTLKAPVLIVHGGAGEFDRQRSPAQINRIGEGLEGALEAGWRVLGDGGPALEAVAGAVAFLEASGDFNAGRGAVATSEGSVETDAAVMEGTTGRVGGICAASWPESPVRAALAVMELGGPRSGPVLLAGAGADRFCEASGLAQRDPARLTGEGVAPISRNGTVGAVALDASGHLAAATSTGGRLGKLPGHVGDSPIVGAGTWADDASVAVSATGEGESFLVAGFAHKLAWALAAGADLESALRRALSSVRDCGGHGGAIVLAPDGRYAVAFDTLAMARAWRATGISTVRPIWPDDSL